jgi:predicted choloylglycine hydrolase
MHRFKKITRIFLKTIVGLIILFLILLIIFKITTKISPPEIQDTTIEDSERLVVDSTFYAIKNNWLQKNKYGLWEMYLEGEAYERGVINGKLTKDLIYKQENAFVKQIKEMIPSESYLKFLKSFIAFFNRNIDKHVIPEYQQEIYGISQSASEKFSFIGPNYHRILNYHAAHDIGHALQNMNLVACTAFAGWDNRTSDSSLIIGRNFDFYVGDKFAEDKIVMFCNPEHGHKFMIVTWGGMIGATSGMNDQGLTVTLNAAKSDIPFGAATPISLVAREILQYASTIDEAYAIAKKRKTFVSEQLFIGSAKDRKTVTIEKSPKKQALFTTNNDYLICSNHFQSTELQRSEIIHAHTSDYATLYRFKRVKELLKQTPRLTISNVATILRNQKGLNDKNIGMGNEKAINQLIAHHSIIFKPEELKVWVSTNPFQLGQYLCYDLNTIFNEFKGIKKPQTIYKPELTIAADPFLYSNDFKKYNQYKNLREQIRIAIKNSLPITNENILLENFSNLNPKFYETYEVLGDYYNKFNIKEKAITYYNKALQREIPNIYQKEKIEKKLTELQE